MKKAVVIPTYWGRKKEVGWQEGDAVYDHPTALDDEGTLARTLESMKILENKEFELIIPICPTADEIENEAVKKVTEIIKSVNLGIETYIFTPRTIREIEAILLEHGLQDASLLNITGYSNVRNMCIYSAQLINADVAILIDDDEIFESPDFIDIAVEHIGKRKYGKTIYGMAGYYLNKFDEFYDDVDIVPWMTYWNRFGSKTEAFDRIIGSGPRIKVTPFAFGGAMVIHKNLFQLVPFDPEITRGEDIDYLINSKMFGYDFFLDTELNIKHLPPKKNHPIWKRFREDIYRFLFEKDKITNQKDINYMTRIEASDFDPYPGDFLKQDLEDKIFKTNVLLALEYLSEGDIEGSRQSIKNVYLSKYEAKPKFDVFERYTQTQQKWREIIKLSIKYRRQLRKIMEEYNLSKEEVQVNMAQYENITLDKKVDKFKQHEAFENFSDEEIIEIAKFSSLSAYKENEVIFETGDRNLCVYAVLTGCVRIVKYNTKGEEIFLSALCSDSIIGETALLKDKFNSTGIADEFVELLAISKDNLKTLITKNPELGNKIMNLFLKEIYTKLHETNKLYQDKIIKEEHIEE